MEFNNFLKILKRHKYTIVIIPVIAVIITYFLVRNQPDSYLSQAKMATGIVDQTQKVINDGPDAQESKISQEFSNLIEMLKSKKIVDQLSYKLIIHDLTSKDPYRKPSPLFKTMNDKAKQHALQLFTDKYQKREALSLFNKDQNGMHKLLISMDYDEQSIARNLTVYRVQNSDYIDIQFESESSDLSAVVVNTLCDEFIAYYTLLIKENQRKAVDFWGSLLMAKEDTLNKRMAVLKAYKIKNHVLNLNEKAKSIYGQMTDFETRREEVEKTVQSTQGAVENIDKQFDPNDRKYLENNKIAVSQQILATRVQLQGANEAYVKSNFDPKYKRQIDSLTGAVSSQIEKLSDKYVLNPLSAKQSLVDQKLTLQVQNQLAKHSSGAINKELARLYTEFDHLVPHEGTIQALESAITVASQEYLEILEKYNQTNMVSKFSIQLRIIELAEPGQAQPSKKMLLVIISGIVSFVFCIAIFFVLFYFDNTIKSARELANRTKLPVLGHINLLSSKAIELHEIWKNLSVAGETKLLRNLMQSLRFEVDKELADKKVLLINSISKGEGKTFIAVNLAYAWATVNKKVLVIDGNFKNPGITEFSKAKFYLEDLLNGTIDEAFLSAGSKIQFLGNKGGEISLLELASEHQITEKLGALKAAFDVIIIEASSLDNLNKSKEWVAFSDKILTVFEAGNNINEKYKQNIEYLKSTNEKFTGWVLNLVQGEEKIMDNE
jgi:succinoglycan biosynthesis transport protein ExoP